MRMKSWLRLLLALPLFALYLNCTGSNSASQLVQASRSVSAAENETEGGHEHGNGGDDTRLAKAAWFGDSEKTVHYCVQVAADFPVTKETVISLIQSSLTDWNSILRNPKVLSFTVISKDFILDESCQNADLQFLMGTPAPENVSSDIGAAVRENYQTSQAWSHGSIWISKQNFWAETIRLKGALLHLLGEVHGFANLNGTILSDSWQDWIRSPMTKELESRLSVIESGRKLVGLKDSIKMDIQLTDRLKSLFHLSTQTKVSTFDVRLPERKIIVDGKTYGFDIVYSRDLKNGEVHRAVFFNKIAPYNFLKTIPHYVSLANSSNLVLIRMKDLQNQPQLILEINEDLSFQIRPL